jgi:hypothetical protein
MGRTGTAYTGIGVLGYTPSFFSRDSTTLLEQTYA